MLTLTLQTCAEEKAVSAPDVASRRLGQPEAYFAAREVLLLARAQMACTAASLAGSGLQR
jgi:hypothetical protein